MRDRLGLLGQLGFQIADDGFVDVAQLAQPDHPPPQAAQQAQGFDEVGDRAVDAGGVGADRGEGFLREAADLPLGLALLPGDLFVFAHRGLRGVADRRQRGGHVGGVVFAQPEVGVQQVGGGADQIDVQVGVEVASAHQVQHLGALGHAADHVAVADLKQPRVGFGGGDAVRADKGRLPDLNGVVLLRGGVVAGFEKHQLAIAGGAAGQGVAVGQDRGLDLLRNEVVGQDDVEPGVALIEDVGEVFAVGAFDAAVKHQPGGDGAEKLPLAGGQVHAVGQHQAVVFGQQHGGVGHAVGPHHLVQLGVVNKVPPGLFLVGADAQQHQRALDHVVHLGVVQALVRVVDGLGVEPLAAVGVVFDLDGEVAAGGLYKAEVFDVVVRKRPLALHVAGGAFPGEVVLRRVADLVVAAIA